MTNLIKTPHTIAEVRWFDPFTPNTGTHFKSEISFASGPHPRAEQLATNLLTAFHKILPSLLIDNRGSWWDYFLEVDDSDSEQNGYWQRRRHYESMLIQAGITSPADDHVACTTSDWKAIFEFTFETVIERDVLYSPLFFSIEHNLVFYIHHSGEIGLYFLEKNATILEISSKVAEMEGQWIVVREPED